VGGLHPRPDFGVKTLEQLKRSPPDFSPIAFHAHHQREKRRKRERSPGDEESTSRRTPATASTSDNEREAKALLHGLGDPYLEAMRRDEMFQLQSALTSLCIKEGLRHEPSLCFQRWYFVCKSLEKNPQDPLLPSGEVKIEQGLKAELIKAGLAETRAEWVCSRLARAATEACAKMKLCHDTPSPGYDAAHALKRLTAHSRLVRVYSLGDGLCEVSFQYPNSRRECRLHLNGDKLERLQKDYKGPPGSFKPQLFCLLARYDALKGAGYQAALPDALFQLLSERLDVNHECFGSPFNHYLPTYCSAFPDLDRFFGSCGSFLDMQPTTGSFEANPPFVEEVMTILATKIETWLAASVQPLSFVVVLPGWADTPSYDIFTHSAHLRCHLFFDRGRHAYKEGFQHTLKHQYKTAECQTFMFILQNPAGADKWPITESLKKEIQIAFLPPSRS